MSETTRTNTTTVTVVHPELPDLDAALAWVVQTCEAEHFDRPEPPSRSVPPSRSSDGSTSAISAARTRAASMSAADASTATW